VVVRAVDVHGGVEWTAGLGVRVRVRVRVRVWVRVRGKGRVRRPASGAG